MGGVKRVRRVSPLTVAVVTTVVFVMLKLAGQVEWSWWLVFSPILFLFVILALTVMVIGVLVLIDDEEDDSGTT